MNAEQQQAYDWAKNQNYQSIAARYARTLTTAVDDLQSQLAAERVKFAELQRYNVDCTKQFGMLQMDKVNLQNLLAESQRREREAVEDITTMAKCKLLGTCAFCKHRNTPDMRYKPCKGCIQENRSRKNFEWRGPQEAGKGEAE